jgi:hypothetical protein
VPRQLNEIRFQFYGPPWLFEALETVASANSMSISSLIRMTLSNSLTQAGYAPPRSAAANGHQQAAE